METYLGNKIIEEASGSEFTLNKSKDTLEYITTSGEIGEYSGNEINNLFESSVVEYNILSKNRTCLIINEIGFSIYLFNFENGIIKIIKNIERINEFNNGFDYCKFKSLSDDKTLLVYELGAIMFDNNAKVVWEINFDGLHVIPEINDNEIIYSENKFDHIYSLKTGKIIKRVNSFK